jgi:hypothetical protein
MAAARTVSMNRTCEGTNTPAATWRSADCSAVVACTGRQTTTTEPAVVESRYGRISWDNTPIQPGTSATRPRRTGALEVPAVSPLGQLRPPWPATHVWVRPLPRMTATAVGKVSAFVWVSTGCSAAGPLLGCRPEITVVETDMPTSFLWARIVRQLLSPAGERRRPVTAGRWHTS